MQNHFALLCSSSSLFSGLSSFVTSVSQTAAQTTEPVVASLSLFDGSTFSARSMAVVVIHVLTLIACVTVHEFGHAYVADRLGDPLPREQGRVTLNPLAHMDWLGTVLFPALMALGAAIPLAWGKPVEWTGNPRYFSRRWSMRSVRLLVSTAGPAMNLLLAIFSSIVFVVAMKFHAIGIAAMSRQLLLLNLGLMCFNLLPIPPLDGRTFLEFLPNVFSPVRDFLFRYGSFVFLGLILLPPIGGLSPLHWLMTPFFWFIEKYMFLLMYLV